MARINFIVPGYSEHKFSGGLLCIFEYAHGLTNLGHDVAVVPVRPSPKPKWFPKPVKTIDSPLSRRPAITLGNAMWNVVKAWTGKDRWSPVGALTTTWIQAGGRRVASDGVQIGASLQYALKTAPPAEIVIATAYQTALHAALLPAQKRFYFCQHFEPYFKNEANDPEFAERLAHLTYSLGLRMIANSSWLQGRLRDEVPGTAIDLCPNAISHEIFHGQPKVPSDSKRIVLISYGGRDARWKGFEEMAQAVAIARRTLPDYELVWKVYGDALLPPDNSIARYEPLGFLASPQLAEKYREADILLSASWYESFPLFPLEAMACGLPVITTQSGVEEYGFPDETVKVVQPQNPDSIAEGLIDLVRSPQKRERLAERGRLESLKFNWDRSVQTMAGILGL